MISVIVIGILVGSIYGWFMKKDIRIKLPQRVPEGGANSFTAFIPSFVVIVGETLVY